MAIAVSNVDPYVCFLLRFQYSYVNQKRQEWEAGLIGRTDCWQTNKQRFIIQQIAPLKTHLRKGCKTSMFNFHTLILWSTQNMLKNLWLTHRRLHRWSVSNATSSATTSTGPIQSMRSEWVEGAVSLGFCSLDLDMLNDGYVEWLFPGVAEDFRLIWFGMKDGGSISQSRDLNISEESFNQGFNQWILEPQSWICPKK